MGSTPNSQTHKTFAITKLNQAFWRNVYNNPGRHKMYHYTWFWWLRTWVCWPCRGGAKVSTERGCRDTNPMSWGSWRTLFLKPAGTQVLCHEVPGWLCSWYAWKTCVCVLGGKGEHRKGMCGQGSSWCSWQTLLLKPLKSNMGFLALLGGQRVASTVCCPFWGGKGQHWRGCRDTSPMPWGSWQTLLLKLLKEVVENR